MLYRYGSLTIDDREHAKVCSSPDYNYVFDKETGEFMRWGETRDDDPLYCPIGPEILDIEISVNGCPNACKFCYKANNAGPARNMTFQTFDKIISMMPKVLTQVAFGITGVQTNPDFLRMMERCRALGIVPNFTLSGIDLTDDMAQRCSRFVGAVAVSAYQTNKNVCYNTVRKFCDLGITQTNIHLMVSEQTFPFALEVIRDRQTDPRLKDMNAIVFLGLKPKGRAADGFSIVRKAQYAELIKTCLDNGIAFGFDSCSAPKFEAWVKGADLPEKTRRAYLACSEPCESSLFSSYINVDGKYWHCSFAEGNNGQKPVDVTKAEDFTRDVWNAPEVIAFRNRVIKSRLENSGNCVVYPQIWEDTK